MVKVRYTETQLHVLPRIYYTEFCFGHTEPSVIPSAIVHTILNVSSSDSGMLCSKDADLIGHVVV